MPPPRLGAAPPEADDIRLAIREALPRRLPRFLPGAVTIIAGAAATFRGRARVTNYQDLDLDEQGDWVGLFGVLEGYEPTRGPTGIRARVTPRGG